MNIYFAGSIRAGRSDQALYQNIISYLGKYGKVLTEHVGHKSLSEHPSDQEIYDQDIAWLKQADCVVAEVSTPSLGVGYEIAKAEEWGKKVLCIYRKKENTRLSAMISGSPMLTAKLYNDIDDAKIIIDDYFRDLK